MLGLSRETRNGFTLVELLVVIAILSVLVALLVPAVQKMRESASRTQCLNHLKQMGLAIHSYHDANHRLPPDRITNDFATWAVLILPFLEQDDIFQLWDLKLRYAEQPGSAGGAADPCGRHIPVYYCPSRRTSGTLSASYTFTPPGGGPSITAPPGGLGDYASVSGTNRTNDNQSGLDGSLQIAIPYGTANLGPAKGNAQFNANSVKGAIVVGWQSQSRLGSITDGTSNTLLIGEKYIRPGFFPGKGEDRSIFDGQYDANLGESYRRLLGRAFTLPATNPPNYIPTEPPFPLIGDPALQSNPIDPVSGLPIELNRCFGSRHPGVCPFLFGDASVRSLSVGLSLDVLTFLGIPDDGQAIPPFE